MAKLVSKTYGEALYELATEQNKIDMFLSEVKTILQVLAQNKDFEKLMLHPKISKTEKVEVTKNVFEGRVSAELTGFITLIVSKERYSSLEDILNYFVDRVKEEKGIGVATVTTAVPIGEILKKQIEERLLETTKYKEMEMKFNVDPSIIGGMIIRIKDRVVDSSIQTKLNELQKQLYQIQLG